MNRMEIARWAGWFALAGAAVQVVYGVLACVYRYPQIIGRPFEALWAVANAGMIASIGAWLLLGLASRGAARPRAALIGGGVAILGFLIRIAISLVIEARPEVGVDQAIVASIVLMFAGLAVLGVATLRAGRLSGWPARAPLLVLLGGLIAAPFYSFDKVVHFILLGLLWGPAWLYMAWVGHRQLAALPAAEPAASVPVA